MSQFRFKEERKLPFLPKHQEVLKEWQQQAVTNHGEHTDEGASLPRIGLNVRGEDGIVKSFIVWKRKSLKKFMIAYCEEMSLDPFSIVFEFDGRGVKKEQTPEELQMVDGDEINVLLNKFGA